MKYTWPFNIVFHVLKVLIIKICKIPTANRADFLCLVVFISSYISRYHFFTNCQNFICKKVSFLIFSFLMVFSPPPPPPLHLLRLLRALTTKQSARQDKSFLSMLPLWGCRQLACILTGKQTFSWASFKH